MTYTTKYINKRKAKKPRGYRPEEWISGPDIITHDKYYSWLKHKAQANYRKEEYTITWEQWQALWPTDLWMRRGRGGDNVSLCRIDHTGPWCVDNCHVITRRENLKRQGDFRD